MIVIAILAGMVVPITTLQVLWVNMVSAVTLGLAFAWERAEGDIMRRPPRPTDEPLLTGFMVWRIGFVGTLLLLGAGLLFLQEQARGDTTLEFARTLSTVSSFRNARRACALSFHSSPEIGRALK